MSQKRGPKGWQRSDERMKEDICERLYGQQHIDSSEVTIEVKDGKVTLDGTVNDRHMKHAIEDLVDGVPGVKDIDNRVRVSRDDGSQHGQSGQSGQSGQAGYSRQSGQSNYGSTSAATTGTSSATHESGKGSRKES
jgi:hypothetical protein